MKVVKTKSKLLTYLNACRNRKYIGFVPTMGALHSGHLHLIEASKKECKITICSIFVNPKQFNNPNDFINYPNTLDADLEKLKKLECDVVYTPDVDDLYAKYEKVREFDFGTLSETMEGKFRPGHFNGMATIIEKLFRIINPKIAFFGNKDLQQLQIVKTLVKQMNSKIEIIGITTIREKDGLAKSSRNKLLSKNSKNRAILIYSCLKYCKENKERKIVELKSYIQNQFKRQNSLKLEYAEFVVLDTMEPIQQWQEKNKNAICIAASIDNVRLIDNIIL